MKKGFTLIELLAVIAILSVIGVIAYPKIIDVIGLSRLTAYNVSKKKIIDSAKLKYLADVNSSYITEYTISDLISSGYINDDTKNPLTDEDYSDDTKVLVTNEDGVVKYEYIEGKTLYDYISIKDTKENVYSVNNEYIYKGKNSQNYVVFNGENYRIIKLDKYRHPYLVTETDEKIEKSNIDTYINSYCNDNFSEEISKKIYGKAQILTYELYSDTLLNGSTYINIDNNDWIKANNEYKVITMNNEFISDEASKMYIVIKLNNNVMVSSGSGTQLDPYILEN